MLRALRIFSTMAGLLFPAAALAQVPAAMIVEPAATAPRACAPPADDALQLRPREREAWSDCEKWVWSCLREGHEANLFARQCVIARSQPARLLRRQFELAPFGDGEAFKLANALRGPFIVDVLGEEFYARQLGHNGMRIVGAYFAAQLSLENVTTDRNIVLDQSIMREGLRLTNFRTDKNLSFDGSNIFGNSLMNRLQVSGTLFLEGGVYDRIDLRDARIGASLDASGSFFLGTLRLDRARIDGKVNLVNSRLTELSGWDMAVGGSFWLRHADIRGRIDLTGANIQGDLRMQKVRFGRARDDGASACDWDLADTRGLTMQPLFVAAAGTLGPRDTAPADFIERRPTPRDARGGDLCVRLPNETAATQARRDKKHEVRLRDMTINGTLCMIDLTGAYAPSPQVPKEAQGPVRPQISAWPSAGGLESISIDGTQARSTIIRWRESESLTLWRAVQFKTGNMLIDLSAKPMRHFIDNLEIGSIAFIKSTASDDEETSFDEDFYPYLCDMRPSPDSLMASGSREAHERIAAFFNAPGNEARSVQPFSKIVERLQQSAAASLFLKLELSDFRTRATCANSQFYREFDRLAADGRTGISTALQSSFTRSFSPTLEDGQTRAVVSEIDEMKNIGMDSLCRGLGKAYKYTAGYGHQPHFVLVVIAMFVVLFWGLLRLDKRPPAMDPAAAATMPGNPQLLGLLYAIDMFVPFVRLREEHRNMQPNRASLRVYLVLHRVLGLILTSMLVLGLWVEKH